MNWFFARIELHKKVNKDVSADDYAILHAEMKKVGFVPKINADSGSWYHLLTGEYYRSTTKEQAEVFNDAKIAANETVRQSDNIKSASVFVVNFTHATWSNLEPI